MTGRMISERMACGLLAEIGINRRQALRVLHSGLAGVPYRTVKRTLYDDPVVEALRQRPSIEESALRAARETGLIIGRRAVDVTTTFEDQLEQVSGGWRFGWGQCLWSGQRIRAQGFIGFVATVGGFVTVGADVVGIAQDAPGADGRARTRLELRPPGEWFDDYRERRLATGPGRDVMVVGCQFYRDPEDQIGAA